MDPETQQPGKKGNTREPDVYDLLAWFETNKKKLGIAAVVFVLLGFGLSTLRYLGQQKEAKASAELLQLRATLTPQTNMPPAPASAFMKVAADHSGTSAAERARLLAASTLFTEGKYAEAEAEFSRFVKEHGESPWVASAAFGQAASLEALNKQDEALAAYQAITTKYPDSAVVEDSKLAVARIHESRNQPEQALRIYNELLPTGGTGRMMANEEAFRRKQALLREHPQLDTNRIAPPPFTAPALNATGTNVPATSPGNANSPANPTATNQPGQ